MDLLLKFSLVNKQLDKMNNNQNNKNLGERCNGEKIALSLRGISGLTACGQTSYFVYPFCCVSSSGSPFNGKAEKIQVNLDPFTKDASAGEMCEIVNRLLRVTKVSFCETCRSEKTPPILEF